VKHRRAREAICRTGAHLAARGLSPGTSGNLSVRIAGGYIVTPTNASLATLEPDALSLLDEHGEHIDGAKPTKERALHIAVYRERSQCNGIVHLHSTYAVAYSCLCDRDPSDAMPPITPYAIMRLGRVALIEYVRPGDARLAELVAQSAREHHAILLANHGPVFAGTTLEAATAAAEELEETAKLYFILHDHPTNLLNKANVDELRLTN